MLQAASSERRSSSERSATPLAVRRAVRTRPSAWLCSTHPRLPERPTPGQEFVVQRADVLGDCPVEPPYLADHRLVHSLTIVREWTVERPRQPKQRGGTLSEVGGGIYIYGSWKVAQTAFSHAPSMTQPQAAASACTT